MLIAPGNCEGFIKAPPSLPSSGSFFTAQIKKPLICISYETLVLLFLQLWDKKSHDFGEQPLHLS